MRVARVLLVLLVGALLAVPGVAAAAPEPGGWIRLAHLSPDTPAVDVELSGPAGTVLSLTDVGYGDVGAYVRVPAGTYTAAMTPPGSSVPVATGTVEVVAGAAHTVAAVGRRADLTAAVLTDDLAPPPPGQARIRLLQASVTEPEVTVTAVGGPVLARDAAFASTTGYALIPAGSWSLEVTADGARVGAATGVVVTAGSVNTLVVLDGPDGSVTVVALQDAAGTAVPPAGGVETGGGGSSAPRRMVSTV